MTCGGPYPRTTTSSRAEIKLVGGVFYEAAIAWDLIVGYDFLLLPHKKGLVIEKGGDVTLFTGTNKEGGAFQQLGMANLVPRGPKCKAFSASRG